MLDGLTAYTREHRDAVYALLSHYFSLERLALLGPELARGFEVVRLSCEKVDLEDSPLAALARHAQQGIFHRPWAHFAIRESVGLWRYARIHLEHLVFETEDVRDFLRFQESLVAPGLHPDEVLEIDLAPFGRGFPRLTEARSIGQGFLFLNRRLAGSLHDPRGDGLRKLLEFLSVHAIDGQNVLVQAAFPEVQALRGALRRALARLEKLDGATPWSAVADALGKMGFAPGWGDTVGRTMETMGLLVDILEAASPAALEAFLASIPMISKLLVLSPHGYFAQDNVVGLPDTGGQVIYILDQVRALEREMRERLARQGVPVEPKILIVTRLIPDCGPTTCNQRLEKVTGTSSTRILRVPFCKPTGEVIPHWISRFQIWPYLPQFARDVEREALAELGGRPDLIIGNYSDGNLVASLLSQRLGVTQGNIAHALEINKYPQSTLQWKEHEETYHFSCQYTADLIAMNTADFIISSTYQEIAGTDTTVGQYEAYTAFTMPGLFRVVNGVNPFDPKFNIVSPGADAEVYFPHTDKERRLTALLPSIESAVYGTAPLPAVRGVLEDQSKVLVFTMARLDRIKNLTGLVEWFGMSERLRERANLLVVGGSVDPAPSADHEEQAQIHRMHELFDHYGLDRHARWLGMRLDRTLAGELYRFVADRRGVFVQPALYEAFGLTVIEAMVSGLPTFATRHGGPLEIIEPGRSGFHIDPHDGIGAAEQIAQFLDLCREDPGAWERISRGAVARVQARYTWKKYAERIMTFSRIYGFWKFMSNLEREETDRYLQMLYQLQLRPLAAALARDTERPSGGAPASGEGERLDLELAGASKKEAPGNH